MTKKSTKIKSKIIIDEEENINESQSKIKIISNDDTKDIKTYIKNLKVLLEKPYPHNILKSGYNSAYEKICDDIYSLYIKIDKTENNEKVLTPIIQKKIFHFIQSSIANYKTEPYYFLCKNISQLSSKTQLLIDFDNRLCKSQKTISLYDVSSIKSDRSTYIISLLSEHRKWKLSDWYTASATRYHLSNLNFLEPTIYYDNTYFDEYVKKNT